jgi:hypothetical protein
VAELIVDTVAAGMVVSPLEPDVAAKLALPVGTPLGPPALAGTEMGLKFQENDQLE